MSKMKDLAIERMNEEHEEHIPDPSCCPDCYRAYWAMVEAGETTPDNTTEDS